MSTTFLLEQFEGEVQLSREVLRVVPADGLDWKPHADSYSLGRLAMHVASIPGWVPALATAADYDMGEGGPGPAVPVSRDEILAKLDEAVARGRQALTALDDSRLADAWSLRRHGELVAAMSRGEAIARYVIRHLVHHRGQLTVYLRLRGVPVPPLYGDSADLRMRPPGLAS